MFKEGIFIKLKKRFTFLKKNSYKIKLFDKNYLLIKNIIIVLLVYIIILYKKINGLGLMNKIYKIFNAYPDIDLFLNNKTEFYFKTRKEICKNYNESHLITFQDKLNYLIIHESAEYKSNIVDKIKLKEYSKKVLGKDICIPIIKIYNNANEINLDILPDRFVLKCNHGSGMNIFCKDKSKFDLEMAKKKLNDWLNINYGLVGAEFQYYFIHRKIFASPYMGDIIDYKTFCFNGIPKFIAAKIALNEERNRFIYNYYDLNWTLTNIEYGSRNYIRDPNILIEKPKNLNILIYYAKKLSNEFVFVRVDFYEINGTIYLGELTFTPSNLMNSFKNEEQSIYLGNLLDINKIRPYLYNN